MFPWTAREAKQLTFNSDADKLLSTLKITDKMMKRHEAESSQKRSLSESMGGGNRCRRLVKMTAEWIRRQVGYALGLR